MSLGCNQLTDDQLLELLQEACAELGARDPAIRGIAQEQILSEAEKAIVAREAIKEAVEGLRATYKQGLRQEALVELQNGIKMGTISLLTPEEEASAIAETSIEARIELIDGALETITRGELGEGDFALRVHGDTVSISWAGERMHWKAQPPSWKLHELARTIRQTFTGGV